MRVISPGDRRQVHPIGSFRRKVHHLLNSRNVLPMCCQCAAIRSQDCDRTFGNDGSIVALQHPLMPNAFSVIVNLSTLCRSLYCIDHCTVVLVVQDYGILV